MFLNKIETISLDNFPKDIKIMISNPFLNKIGIKSVNIIFKAKLFLTAADIKKIISCHSLVMRSLENHFLFLDTKHCRLVSQNYS